jgi:hypothetical protein
MAKKNVKSAAVKEREAEILKSMKGLGISREEAEELYAFDHDEIECEEVAAIEEKIATEAGEEKKAQRSPLEKVKLMKAKKKVDAEKSSIIDRIFGFVRAQEDMVGTQEMTSTKMSFMGESGTYYSVTITKHKSRPDGYSGVEK